MAVIAEVGVGEIWLTPIHPSPSYHMCDVADYYAVDPLSGSYMRSSFCGRSSCQSALWREYYRAQSRGRAGPTLSALRHPGRAQT